MSNAIHGVALVERVIEKIREKGFKIMGAGEGDPSHAPPRPLAPAVLEQLTFPDGSALSPSLRRWLAFDAAWLGWFEDYERPVFKPKKLGRFAKEEYERDWGYGRLERRIGGDCFLLAAGSESRQFLYVGKPDSTGEHPVLLTDTDDAPYLCVEYPGIDVFLGIEARVIDYKRDVYGGLADDARYAERMKEHAVLNLAGMRSIENAASAMFDDERPPPWKDGEPVPDGFRVAVNPFTKAKRLVRR